MIITNPIPGAPVTRYRCDGCGKTRDYLSESWSTILMPDSAVVHHCLECRSDKKEYRP